MARLKSRSIRSKGARAERWAAWHEASRRKVLARSRGACENCNDRESGLDWCHLFSRRAILSEPLASCPQFTAALCRTCHNAIDRAQDNEARARLRWQGLVRFVLAIPDIGPYIEGISDPVDKVREIDRILSDWSTIKLSVDDLQGTLLRAS